MVSDLRQMIGNLIRVLSFTIHGRCLPQPSHKSPSHNLTSLCVYCESFISFQQFRQNSAICTILKNTNRNAQDAPISILTNYIISASQLINHRKDENMENVKEYTPQEYFDYVKGKKQQISDKALQQVYDNCMVLINKYKVTGQTKGLRKLIFHTECLEKERALVKLGITTFVYRDDIEEYISNVADDAVVIIELANYEREVPDEIVQTIAKVKDIFDEIYVVFTDYAGKTRKQVARERQAKDPIVFGAFLNEESRTVIDRFYYLGDWEDEYCNLTLDKMVNETKEKKGVDIEQTIKTPEDLAELKQQLDTLELNKNRFRIIKAVKPKGFFQKVKSVFWKST